MLNRAATLPIPIGMGRPRSRARRDWPEGLDETKPGYYVWRHPTTGVRHAIGRVPLADAKVQALEALMSVRGMAQAPRLVDRIGIAPGAGSMTVEQWLTAWADKTRHEVTANTDRSRRGGIKAIAERIGSVPLPALTTRQVAEAVDEMATMRGGKMATNALATLKGALRAAIAAGLLRECVADVVRPPKVVVQRRRFTADSFLAVWRELESAAPFLRTAAALALISGQRREDVARARFADIRDGVWLLQQGKTGRRLAIPTALRLDLIGMSIADVIAEAQADGLGSEYIVHNGPAARRAHPGTPVSLPWLSHEFSAVVTRVDREPSPPTFHELRSLSKRLHEQAGTVDTRVLLGHASESVARRYADPRGAEFEQVRIR